MQVRRFLRRGRSSDPYLDDPTVREVIQGSYRIVYRLIRKEIHIVAVHHTARLLRLEP